MNLSEVLMMSLGRALALFACTNLGQLYFLITIVIPHSPGVRNDIPLGALTPLGMHPRYIKGVWLAGRGL